MTQLSNTFFKSRAAFLQMSVLCALMILPDIVDARSARASGGFSRNSPASSGSISSRPAGERRTDAERKAVARQLDTARDARDLEQPRAGSNTADLSQSTQPASPVRSAEAATPESRPVRDKPVSAKEMAAYREEFKKQNKGRDIDRDDDWDDNRHGDVERPVAAAVVVGAAAAVRTDAYLDYVHENDEDDLAYYSELPCPLRGVTAVNDVTYYVCEKEWYVRGYEGGSVVYIKANPPPGQ